MIGICRVCDGANTEEQLRFLELRNGEAVFKLTCRCGAETEVKANGDLWVAGDRCPSA